MDLHRVQNINEPLNELHHNDPSKSIGQFGAHSLTGAKVVQHTLYDSSTQPIISTLSNT